MSEACIILTISRVTGSEIGSRVFNKIKYEKNVSVAVLDKLYVISPL